MYENSDSFRDYVDLERYGVNPTLTIAAGPRTRITLGYEHLHDTRVADRGITSFQGRPADVAISTYYGNPDDSHVRADVDLGHAPRSSTRRAALTLRNRTLFGDYDRAYQNYVPGAVNAEPDAGRAHRLQQRHASATNLFNQTDVDLLAGHGPREAHAARRASSSAGRTPTTSGTPASSTTRRRRSRCPTPSPTITTPVTFRQSATDADNHLTTNVAATYVQDQVELSPKVQLVAGLRFDRFDLTYHNNRNGDTLDRVDNLRLAARGHRRASRSPPVSLYGSYTRLVPAELGRPVLVAHHDHRAGRSRRSSRTTSWGPSGSRAPGLALTTAVYRLDRTNTRSTDPNDPTRIVQTGSQRTNGFELGVTGHLTSAWRVAGGYAYQDAFVTSATAAARAGAQVAQVPHHTFSLWNHYQVLSRLGVGRGHPVSGPTCSRRSTTPSRCPATRASTSRLFYALTRELRLQANLENVFDTKYWIERGQQHEHLARASRGRCGWRSRRGSRRAGASAS